MSQITVDVNLCKGDGACAAVCPARALTLNTKGIPEEAPEGNCILCGHCVAVCPHDALTHTGLPQEPFLPASKKLPVPAVIDSFLMSRRSVREFKLNQAAVRVYTSPKYEKRGKAGEIALHAICRDFFETIPISPRVFYKSASNDVVKAFDMVHARLPAGEPVELWLGESKLWKKGESAIASAISSVRVHIDCGFLANEKIILGPQIPKGTPRYEEVLQLFHKSTSLDAFLKSAVFVVGIMCDSESVNSAHEHDAKYISGVEAEMEKLAASLNNSGLPAALRMLLVYVPIASKESLVAEFDSRLKGLQ